MTDAAARERFMREAIRLAAEGARAGWGGPFGAVVVRDGAIVGRGCNRVVRDNDPTAHAEIVAIRDACARRESFWLEDCELFSSCEPCPMCQGAIDWARIPVVHHAASRQDAADAGFADALFHAEQASPAGSARRREVQLLRDEARAVMDEWRSRPDRRSY